MVRRRLRPNHDFDSPEISTTHEPIESAVPNFCMSEAAVWKASEVATQNCQKNGGKRPDNHDSGEKCAPVEGNLSSFEKPTIASVADPSPRSARTIAIL